MKRTNFPLVVVVVLGLSTLAQAEMIRGKIITPDDRQLEYIYESSSNTFALNVLPLVKVEVVNTEMTQTPRDKCSAWRDFLKEGNSTLQASSFENLHPSSPLRMQIRMIGNYKDPAYSGLVQEDLQRRNKWVAAPKNVTFVDRLMFRLGFIWKDRALSVLGKSNLQSDAEKSLGDAAILDNEGGQMMAYIDLPRAKSYLICDLQERNLQLQVSYRFQNQFHYFERGRLTPEVFKTLWKGISDKADAMNETASRSDLLSDREARLVAASSFLTLEIMKSPIKADLLRPDTFMKTFSAIFNNSTIAPRSWFDQEQADDIADRMGKSITLDLSNIEGTTAI